MDELKDKLKVQEIDVLYKESDGLSLKVVKTLDINEYNNDQNYFISLLVVFGKAIVYFEPTPTA